jgi:hypothetical protein
MSIDGNGAHDNGNHDTEPLESGGFSGVRVVVDPEPAAAAARLAEQLDGDVIVDRDGAEAAVAARREAATHIDLDVAAGPNGPPVDEAALDELRELADALERTARIRSRTEVEFSETLTQRLSASSGVAVHPETIRRAASSLTDAEREVGELDETIEQLGDRPRPEQIRLDAPTPVPQMFDDEGLERRRGRLVAFSVLIIFLGVALLLGSLTGFAVALLVALAGVIVSGLLLARSARLESERDDVEGEREASALLASATDNATRSTEAAARSRLAEEEWLARRSQLESARERAEEKLRSARRHWETLAGPEADPHDLDTVLRVNDPQFLITGAATKTSPTVRTVTAVHRRAVARWKVAWASLGYDTPPDPAAVDAELAQLEAMLHGDEGDGVDYETMLLRPIILVEPETWLPEDELTSLLASRPPETDVILVTR